MYTETDNKNGLVKATWSTVRDRVKTANPEFAKLIDELSPDYNLYIAYAKYGHFHGDVQGIVLPSCSGEALRLNSSDLHKKIAKDLGYGTSSSPFGMVLEKNLEYFIDVPRLNVTLPRYVRKPGSDHVLVSRTVNISNLWETTNVQNTKLSIGI